MGGINIRAFKLIKNLISNLVVIVLATGRIATSTLVESIFKFCELYSGIKMYPYEAQFGKRIIRALLDNDGDELTALFARQMGK
jgi:hypothetical protein